MILYARLLLLCNRGPQMYYAAMPEYRYPLVVKRNDEPPTTVQVPAPSLEDAVRTAEKAGWTVVGSAGETSVKGDAATEHAAQQIAKIEATRKADIEARRLENQTLTGKDIERAVVWGVVKGLIIFSGLAIILSFAAAIIIALLADQTVARFM